MKLKVRGVDVSGKLRPGELSSIAVDLVAHDGELAQGLIPQPDTTGAEYQAGDNVTITDGSGPSTIINGFIAGQTTDRPEPMIGRRVHHFTLHDGNALLYGMRAVKWKRPAETDRARVLASAAAFWPTLDTTWVLSTATATLPAKTYDTDTIFAEILADVKAATAKTMYVENGRLHSHLLSEGQTADWSIGEADPPYEDVWPIREGTAQRTRDALQLVNDVIARNNAGETGTASDAGSKTLHDAGGLKHEAIVNVPDAATGDLNAYAASYVAYNKDERYTYEGEIGPLEADDVIRLIPGCLVTCTQPVWKVTSTVLRLARVTLKYVHPGHWYAHVYLAFPIRYKFEPEGKLAPPTMPACLVSLGGSALSEDTYGAGTFPKQPCVPINHTVGSRLMCGDNGVGNPCYGGFGSTGTLFWGATTAVFVARTPSAVTKPAGAVIARFTAQVSTDSGFVGNQPHGWQLQVMDHPPVGFYDGQTAIRSDVADHAVTGDAPANAFADGQVIYAIEAPSWQEPERRVCGVSTNPWPGGDYWSGSISVEWFGFCDGARGMSNWTGGIGAVDGVNDTYELPSWDGTGTPEARINGLGSPVSADSSAKTVTFLDGPPPVGSWPTFNYPVVN